MVLGLSQKTSQEEVIFPTCTCSLLKTHVLFRPTAGTFTGRPWRFSALITPAVFPTTNTATYNIRTKAKDADSQR